MEVKSQKEISLAAAEAVSMANADQRSNGNCPRRFWLRDCDCEAGV
jgi:hypothetical protein